MYYTKSLRCTVAFQVIMLLGVYCMSFLVYNVVAKWLRCMHGCLPSLVLLRISVCFAVIMWLGVYCVSFLAHDDFVECLRRTVPF